MALAVEAMGARARAMMGAQFARRQALAHWRLIDLDLKQHYPPRPCDVVFVPFVGVGSKLSNRSIGDFNCHQRSAARSS